MIYLMNLIGQTFFLIIFFYLKIDNQLNIEQLKKISYWNKLCCTSDSIHEFLHRRGWIFGKEFWCRGWCKKWLRHCLCLFLCWQGIFGKEFWTRLVLVSLLACSFMTIMWFLILIPSFSPLSGSFTGQRNASSVL